MEEDSQSREDSKLAEGARLTAVAWLTELGLLVVGFALLGAAYTSNVHLVALIIAVPLAFYVFRKWIKRPMIVESLAPADSRETFPCPCCRFKTVVNPAGFDICPVCYWQDDGQSDVDADKVRGGPNGALSLTAARRNFSSIGACSERFLSNVRPPLPDELPIPHDSAAN